jgi:DNA repair photolyase
VESYPEYLKGRGAQLNPPNRYGKARVDTEGEWMDEALLPGPQTEFLADHPKSILSHNSSPDIPLAWSLNPYQGCEHGCTYCYARETHNYWGLSAGLDFERKIIVKENAPELLEQAFDNPKWKPAPVMFSGNTDCYQPVERRLQLTRRCLEVFLRYRNPASLITKNSLILRDLDLLVPLAEQRLVHVAISLTTLDEDLRRAMEPRTVPGSRRIEVIRRLSEAGVPVFAMLGPVIPGLNNHEIPALLEAAAAAGACGAGYNLVHLNGEVGLVFEHWLRKAFPDRAEKVLSQIRACHGGSLEDRRFGTRMRGEGSLAESIRQLFTLSRKRLFEGRSIPPYDLEAFRRPPKGQLSLFA